LEPSSSEQQGEEGAGPALLAVPELTGGGGGGAGEEEGAGTAGGASSNLNQLSIQSAGTKKSVRFLQEEQQDNDGGALPIGGSDLDDHFVAAFPGGELSGEPGKRRRRKKGQPFGLPQVMEMAKKARKRVRKGLRIN
jgi:hypothetical protein